MLLFLSSQTLLAENKNLSLVCNGLTNVTWGDGQEPIVETEVMTFIFEDGYLKNSRPSNKPTNCAWSKSSIVCHGVVSLNVENGTTFDGKYDLTVDRLSGKGLYYEKIGRLQTYFKSDCKQTTQKF